MEPLEALPWRNPVAAKYYAYKATLRLKKNNLDVF